MSIIKRLPRYYRFLQSLKDNGIVRISSKELADRMGLTASQIRHDFNSFGGFGQQGYGYNVPELQKLGADIVLSGKTARVRGVAHLHGAMLRAEDLRGAAALITAGLLAEGESEVLGLSHLARGYENLEQNLKISALP